MRPFLLSFLLSLCLLAKGQDPLCITINDQTAGASIPNDFIGLSYETRMLMPDAAGKHYFSPSNQTLIRLFRRLGIKSLRIGGSSVDVKDGPVPALADIDQLFAFAREAGVKVIYSAVCRTAMPLPSPA